VGEFLPYVCKRKQLMIFFPQGPGFCCGCGYDGIVAATLTRVLGMVLGGRRLEAFLVTGLAVGRARIIFD